MGPLEEPGGSAQFDYGSIGAGYYDEVYHRRRGIQAAWHRFKFDRVAREAAGAARVLDIGCGPGTFLGNGSLGRLAVGVDIAAAQLAYANARYRAEARWFLPIADHRLPFIDGAFDLVTLVEVVEHLHAPGAVLRECLRVLAPGGRVVLTTPNYGSHWPLLEWLLGRLGPVDYEHQHVSRFRRRPLAAVLGSVGFDDVVVRSFQRTAPFAAGLSWSLGEWMSGWEDRIPFPPGALLLAEARRPATR